MTNYIELALTYGGFTSLDKVYLKGQLKKLSDEEKLAFITPPPSVINAYFAELYQKQGAKAATDYYFNLSKALQLLVEHPSFAEEKPFVRLNLFGESYGFSYISEDEVAIVFSESNQVISRERLLEIAQLFPHYQVDVDQSRIRMSPFSFDDDILEDLSVDGALLSRVTRLASGWLKFTSFNQEELLELISRFEGKAYYHYSQRQSVIYIKEEKV